MLNDVMLNVVMLSVIAPASGQLIFSPGLGSEPEIFLFLIFIFSHFSTELEWLSIAVDLKCNSTVCKSFNLPSCLNHTG